jgi:orotidine-5'-phosphate decarboxylase
VLVVGYGAQGGGPKDAVRCFDASGGGAIVNSSRGVTYSFPDPNASLEQLAQVVREHLLSMRSELLAALGERHSASASR